MTSTTKNLQVRIPSELHTWLRLEAVRRGTTVKQMITDLITNERRRVEPKIT